MNMQTHVDPDDLMVLAQQITAFINNMTTLQKNLRQAEARVSESWNDTKQREFSEALQIHLRELEKLKVLGEGHVRYLRIQAEKVYEYHRRRIQS